MTSTYASSVRAGNCDPPTGRVRPIRQRRTYRVTEGEIVRLIEPVGRDAWMLDQLLAAGPAGCTSLQNPAPRMSHYVFKLRTRYGLLIETVDEKHGGPYSGTHARYFLRSNVEPIECAPVDCQVTLPARTWVGVHD